MLLRSFRKRQSTTLGNHLVGVIFGVIIRGRRINRDHDRTNFGLGVWGLVDRRRDAHAGAPEKSN